MTSTVPRPSPAGRRVALRDRVLKLAEFVTTPLLPNDYLDLVDPLRSGADLRGRIEAIRPETRDAATVCSATDGNCSRMASATGAGMLSRSSVMPLLFVRREQNLPPDSRPEHR